MRNFSSRMSSPPDDGGGLGNDANSSLNKSNGTNSNGPAGPVTAGANGASSGNIRSTNVTLFSSCRFCVSPAAAEECPALAGQIEAHGGRIDNYLTDMSTHVVVLDHDRDSDLILEATDLYEKPVITPRWVTLSLAANHLLPMEGFNPQRRLFHGKLFCPSALARKDIHALWGMISYHGGRMQLKLDNKCTHLLTTRPGGAKYARAANSPWITIVTPDWIVECVNQRELRPPEPFHPTLLIKTSPIADSTTPPKLTTTPPQQNSAILPEVKPEPATAPSPIPSAGQMMNSTPLGVPQVQPMTQQLSSAPTGQLQSAGGPDISGQSQPPNSIANQMQYTSQIQLVNNQQQGQQMQIPGQPQQQPQQLQQVNSMGSTQQMSMAPQSLGPAGGHVQQVQSGGQISLMSGPSGPPGSMQTGQQPGGGPLQVSQGQSMQAGLQAIASSGPQGQPPGTMGRVMQSGQISPGGISMVNMQGGQPVSQGNMGGQLAQMLTGGQRMTSSPNGPTQMGVQGQGPPTGQMSPGQGQQGTQVVMINQGGKIVPMGQQQQSGPIIPQQSQRMMFQQGASQQISSQQIGMPSQQQTPGGVGMPPGTQSPQMVRMQQWVSKPQGQQLSPQQIQMIRQQRHRMVIAGGPPGTNGQRLVVATPEQLQQMRLRQLGPGGPAHMQQQGASQQMMPPTNQQMVQAQQSGGQIVTSGSGMVQSQQQQQQQQQVMQSSVGQGGQQMVVMAGGQQQPIRSMGPPAPGKPLIQQRAPIVMQQQQQPQQQQQQQQQPQQVQQGQGGQWRFPGGPPGGPGGGIGASWAGQTGGPPQQSTPPLSPVQQQPPQDMMQQQRHLQQQHDPHYQQRIEMQRRHIQMQQQQSMVAVGGVGHMAGSYQAHTQLSPSGGHGGAASTPPPGRVGVGVLTMHRGDTGTPPLSGGPGGHPNHMSGPHGPHHGSGSVVHQGVHHGHGSSHSHGSAHGGPHGGSPHPHHSPGQHHQVIAPRAMPMSPSVASGIGASAVCAATSSQMLRSASPQPHHPLHATQHPQHPQGLLPHIHPQQQQPGGPQQQIQTSQQQSQVQGNQLPGNVHPKMATQMGPNGQRMIMGPHMQRMPLAPGGPSMAQMQLGPPGTQAQVGTIGGPHMGGQQRYVGPMGQQMIGPQGQTPPGVKVNPQTKTALANLLNNRLGGGGQQGEMGPMCPQNGPQPPMGMQPQPQAGLLQGGMRCYQPTGPSEGQSMQPGQAHSGGPVSYRPVGAPLVRAVRPDGSMHGPFIGAHSQHPHAHVIAQETLVGHEQSPHLSADTCFLGCVFYFLLHHSTEFNAEHISIAKGVCEEKGGTVAEMYSLEVTHVVCTHQNQLGVERALRDGKRCITVYWINDCVLQGKMAPPWQALHLPAAFGPREQPCAQHIISSTGFSGEERLRIRTMINKVGAKYSACMTRENSLLIVKSRRWAESGEKLKKAHEWNMACVSAQWLSDVMLGHYEAVRMPMSPKYQVSEMDIPFLRIDYGIAQALLMAWKVPIKISEDQWRSFSESDLYHRVQKRKLEIAEEEEVIRKKKPANDENCVTVTNPNPPSEGQKPLVLFSGIQDPEPLKKMILQLGGQIAKNAKEATHLVLAKFSRTIKVMCAVNHVKHICCPEWVHESHRANTFLDPTEYWLQDSDAEKQFGFSLRYIHMQRQRNAPPPLKGYVFYVTPGCLPTIPVLKEVVEAAGGSMFLNKRPTLKHINQFNNNNNYSNNNNNHSSNTNNSNNNSVGSNNSNNNSMNSTCTGNSANNNGSNKDNSELTTATTTTVSTTTTTTTTTNNSAGAGVTTPTTNVNGGLPPANDGASSKFICVTCEDDLYMCKELLDRGVRLYNVEVILTSILRQKVELDEYVLDCCI
ncbi:PAX-interacting protein 1-like isoform X3 [Varroa destructor]|uniref:PAX-interacting protein 1 n=1 Tax=Varroa destructor TaxID=109461 RepID=A0A7M7M811_VARDE|nr:PAX-interacting protein 1-like isoform X3 [Varroa destructor]